MLTCLNHLAPLRACQGRPLSAEYFPLILWPHRAVDVEGQCGYLVDSFKAKSMSERAMDHSSRCSLHSRSAVLKAFPSPQADGALAPNYCFLSPPLSHHLPTRLSNMAKEPRRTFRARSMGRRRSHHHPPGSAMTQPNRPGPRQSMVSILSSHSKL